MDGPCGGHYSPPYQVTADHKMHNQAYGKHRLPGDWRRWLIGELSLRRMMISLIEIYIALLVFAWLFSDRLIFPPPPPSYQEGGDFYRIPLPDGQKIGMLALTNPAAAFTLLYFHGNAEDLGDIQPTLQKYRDHGFTVYAVDYRGYGISDGRAGSHAACEDGEAALKHLVADRGIPLNRLILHGRSVGTGIALHLAARNKVAGLILESPFVTAFRVRTVIPIAPFDKLRNNQRIREISCPLLVIHGVDDAIIPLWHGQKLYDLATVPKRYWWVPRANHNDIIETDEPGFWRHLTEFRDWVRARRND
jgi:pimeloyl-ACP methyl ester carboxylesterase